MSNNNLNNTNNTMNVSTRGPQSFNGNLGEMDSSTLSLGFWKDCATLKINPILPANQRTGNTTYDYSNGLSGVLNIKNLLKLIKGIEKVIAGELPSITVPAGKTIKVKYTTGEEYGLTPCLVIMEIEPSTDIATNMLIYVFNVDSADDAVEVDYNEETGEKEVMYINVEEELFLRYLNQAVAALTNAQTHAVFNRINYQLDKVNNTLETTKQICVDIQYGRKSSVENSPQANTYSNRQANFTSRVSRRRSGGNVNVADSGLNEVPQATNSYVPPTGGSTRRGRGVAPSNINNDAIADIDIAELEDELLD